VPNPDGGEDHAFAVWHPQWGGYSGKCVVRFDTITGACDGTTGCFDVSVWHDGRFPYDEGSPQEYHYCDAGQLIRLGLDVLEHQVERQKQPDGSPVVLDVAALQHLRDRIDALLGRDS
jgi:hypothetical protein